MQAKAPGLEEMERSINRAFIDFHETLCAARVVPDARFERTAEVVRFYSGVPHPFYNGILACWPPAHNLESFIADQLTHFQSRKVPFIWYVNPDTEPELCELLPRNRFNCPGDMVCTASTLDVVPPQIPVVKGISYELATDQATLISYNELFCTTFGIRDAGRTMIQELTVKTGLGSHAPIQYWTAKKNREIYSILTLLTKEEIAGCWNSATALAARRYGLSSSLRHYAMEQARARGCRIGVTFHVKETSPEHKVGPGQVCHRYRVFLSPYK